MSGPAATAAAAEPVVRLRHPGRWVTSAAVLLAAGAGALSLVTNERYQWPVVAQWFLSTQLVHGLVATLWLTALTMLLGAGLGVVLAVARLSANPVTRALATVYVWFFRGTPVFVQLLFWGYVSALYPRLSIGVPLGPELAGVETNALITPVVAAVLGLGLNEAAYMAEIVRSGIEAVPRGQVEAAQALGMTRARVLRRVVLPQALRVVVPPTANETIAMLKTTSLVSVLAFPELLYSAQLVYSQNFQTVPLLIAAAVWYLLVTSVLTVGQYALERRVGRSDRRAAAPRTRRRTPARRTAGGPA